jgi:intergrase/recombinase
VDPEQIKEAILAKIGLTSRELRDYLKKLAKLYVSLTPKEQKAFRSAASASAKEALKSFRGKITAEELEEFIKSREPKNMRDKGIMLIHGIGCDEDDEKQKQ